MKSKLSGVIVRLNDGLSEAEFEKVMNPYSHNDMDGFNPEKAGKCAVEFIDRNEDVIQRALEMWAAPSKKAANP